MTLTTRVTTSVSRVLQMSCEKTSWPSWVVPSRCAEDGPRFWPNRAACGSYGAIRPGKMATNTTTARITAPAVALRLPMTARRKRRRAPVMLGSGGRSAMATLEAASVAMSGLARARIEYRRDQVRDQHTDEDGQRVEQEQGLHQRQVVIGRGGIEQVSESGIREQVLDHDRPTEHVAELHRESGQVGENRVACPVTEHDAPVRQPLRPSGLDVVLPDGGDHVVPHGVHPQTRRHHHETEAWQERVLEHVADERE